MTPFTILSKRRPGRRWKLAVLLLGVPVMICLAWQLLLYQVLVVGRMGRENLGGHWSLEYQDSVLSSSAPQVSLFWGHGWRSKRVDYLVQEARFYGDDCVVYSTSRGESGFQFLGVCGERTPVVLVPPNFDEWKLQERGLARARVIGSQKDTARMISIAEIKELAKRQPPFRENWFERQSQM